MAKRLRPVTTEFLESAPTRLVFLAELRAKPDAVFRELTDDASTWPLWFRPVRSASYTGPPPYGPAAGRVVRLRGGPRFVESVVVWDESERFVYRVVQTNLSVLDAWMEEWLLQPSADGGTQLRFTVAMDGNLFARAMVRLARGGVARAYRRAAVRLDSRCGSFG